MGRPTKTYNRELKLIKNMKPGTAWLFPVDHPNGFMSKVYSDFSIDLFGLKISLRLSKSEIGVVVIREPESKIPKEKDYANAKS